VNSFVQLNDDEITIIYGGESLFYDIGKWLGYNLGRIWDSITCPKPNGIPVPDVYMG